MMNDIVSNADSCNLLSISITAKWFKTQIFYLIKKQFYEREKF